MGEAIPAILRQLSKALGEGILTDVYVPSASRISSLAFTKIRTVDENEFDPFKRSTVPEDMASKRRSRNPHQANLLALTADHRMVASREERRHQAEDPHGESRPHPIHAPRSAMLHELLVSRQVGKLR